MAPDDDKDDSLDHLPPEGRTQIQTTVIEVAEEYAASIKRSRGENKKRAKGRAKIDEAGVRTDAFQHGLRLVKDLTIEEQKQYLRDLKMVISVVGRRQMELFPEDALRAKKREDDRKAKEAAAGRTPEEMDAASDKAPRSDPKKGGAGSKKPAAKSKAKKPATAKKPDGVGLDGQPLKDNQPATAGEAAKSAVKQGEAMIREGIAKRQHEDMPGGQPGMMKGAEPEQTIEEREQAEGATALSALMPDTEAAKLSQSQQARAILEENGLDKV